MLAEKSVVRIKMIMNFMNEIINTPCNSLLATFFELNFEAYQKKALSCSMTLVRPKRTLSQLFELLFNLPIFDVLEVNVFGNRGEESLVGGPEGPIEVSGVCETEVGTEADVEDEDVDVVGGVDRVGVSGYESEGFTLSEFLR